MNVCRREALHTLQKQTKNLTGNILLHAHERFQSQWHTQTCACAWCASMT